MKIESIVIGERVRKDMGDIESLAESIKRHGLLHPIVIKTDGTLVAGHRRIEAARALGWNDIPVTVINVEDLLSAERDENTERKDFTPTEAVAIGRMIEEQHRTKIDAARHDNAVRAGKLSAARRAGTPVINDTPAQRAGRSDVVAAAAVGLSPMTYYRAKSVMDAAEADPETFGDLPERMDETRQVTAAHEEMKRRKGNGKKTRHPVHKKGHYPKPNREMERSIFSLDGICACLETIPIEQLDAAKMAAWAESLKKSASTINRVARSLNGKA